MRVFIKCLQVWECQSSNVYEYIIHWKSGKNQNNSCKVGFNNALRDVPSSECVNGLLTRNSLVHMCLLLYVYLQHIGKNGVAANAGGCLYVHR